MVDISKPINVTKLLVDFSILAQGCKIFYKSIYTLEGNNSLGTFY